MCRGARRTSSTANGFSIRTRSDCCGDRFTRRRQSEPCVLSCGTAKSLTGTWRTEHIFTLRQSLVAYRGDQEQIQECDAEMYRMLPPSRRGYTVFGECGSDLSAFPSAGHFASWLGLAPNNRITGGKVISTRTRKVKAPLSHRAANCRPDALLQPVRSGRLRPPHAPPPGAGQGHHGRGAQARSHHLHARHRASVL
jgi:hypothetical protein